MLRLGLWTKNTSTFASLLKNKKICNFISVVLKEFQTRLIPSKCMACQCSIYCFSLSSHISVSSPHFYGSSQTSSSPTPRKYSMTEKQKIYIQLNTNGFWIGSSDAIFLKILKELVHLYLMKISINDICICLHWYLHKRGLVSCYPQGLTCFALSHYTYIYQGFMWHNNKWRKVQRMKI